MDYLREEESNFGKKRNKKMMMNIMDIIIIMIF